MKENSIKVLNLSGNCLTDEGIIKLCYELEQTHHIDLEELELNDNKIGIKGGLFVFFMKKTSRFSIKRGSFM